MKNLLAVVDDGFAKSVLETAFHVAQRFNSHITGTNSVSVEYMDTFGLEPHIDFGRADGHHRRAAQSYFYKFMSERGVPFGAGVNDRSSASWIEHTPRQKLSIGMIGRIHDLIIMAQPPSLASIAGAAFEEALFESGRPVLIAPRGHSQAPGDVIGIAWNGSTETAQTVALAMPFLRQAKHVVVIAVGSRHMPEPGPDGVELVRALIQGGLSVSLRSAAGRQKRQGQSFLHEAAAAGVDLLLKGAFTRSRLRQMAFGGATRHIIVESPIPVLIAR